MILLPQIPYSNAAQHQQKNCTHQCHPSAEHQSPPLPPGHPPSCSSPSAAAGSGLPPGAASTRSCRASSPASGILSCTGSGRIPRAASCLVLFRTHLSLRFLSSFVRAAAPVHPDIPQRSSLPSAPAFLLSYLHHKSSKDPGSPWRNLRSGIVYISPRSPVLLPESYG